MSEWWTYTLSDFLLFSPRTYYRMLELYNLAIWPAQVAGIAIGCAIIALLFGKHRWRGRIIAGLLAACWLWIAWAFHYQRYAQINWAAPWFAAAFAIQALLLVVLGVLAGRLVFRPPIGREGWLAMTLAVFAILLYPLLAPLTGRAWMTAETFGVAADPTAIATVAVLARVHGARPVAARPHSALLVRDRSRDAVDDGRTGCACRCRRRVACVAIGSSGSR